MEYAKRSASAADPAMEAMLKITPPPFAFICPMHARIPLYTPFTFTRNSRSKSSSVVLSTVPTCETPRIVHQDLDMFFRKEPVENLAYMPLVRNIARMRRRLPARIGDLFRGSFRLLQIDICNSHCGPICREAQGNRFPDATAAAGHNGGFSVESDILCPDAGALRCEVPLFQRLR